VPKILTLDLGTTYLKASLFNDAGHLCALERVPLSVQHPHEGYWELPNDSFEQTIRELLGQLRNASDTRFDDVAGVTFATQTNSFRLVGDDDYILSPLILWPDQRALDTGLQLEPITQTPNYYATTGVPKLNGQFMLSHLIHRSKRNPDGPKVRRVCLISDVLTQWFTGQHITEAGAAGLTGMIDIHHLQWLDDVCAMTNLAPSCFAKIVRAGTDLGPVRSEIATTFGLPKHCRFIVGCLDQYAGAIGAGNVTAGQLSETTGTVLATVRCADRFDTSLAQAGVFQGPTFEQGLYYQMIFGDTSANLLETYQRQQHDNPSFEQLGLEAEKIPAGCEGLRIDPDAPPRLRFVSHTKNHTRGHDVRAIFEGVAQALQQQIEKLNATDPTMPITSVGGAARSPLWRQIKSKRLNRPVQTTDCPEPTSLGVAILAHSALSGRPILELADAWVKPTRSN